MSKFLKYLISGVILISFVIFAFSIDSVSFFENPVYLVLKIFSFVFLVFWAAMLSCELENMVSFKYKLTIHSYQVEVKYLTSWWLFIPQWLPLDTISDSYKTQNIFGAKYREYYETDVTYNSESFAMEAIEKHKKELKDERYDFFRFKTRKNSIIKYVKK